MERRQQQQQHHWGVRTPYVQPASVPQSQHNSPPQRNTLPGIYPNPDVLGLESVLSNLRVSSDYRLRRYHHLTVPVVGSTWGGADVSSGLRSDPGTGYQVTSLGAQSGNVDVQGLMMRRRAQSGNVGAGDFLSFGGLHHNLNVGPARSWPTAGNGGVGGGGDGRDLRDSASAQPWLWYGGGGGEPLRSRSSEIFYHEQDPFLLCKKPLPGNHTLPFPNVPCLNKNGNLYQNSAQSVDGSVPGNSSFLNAPLTSNLNKKDEIHQGKQQCAVLNLEDMRGKIVSLAKDQNGCRILQDNLIFLDNEGTEIVLSEVIEYVGDLMKNQSGSYLIQKLFSVCSEEQRTNIILAVTKKPFQLVAICLNPFGYG